MLLIESRTILLDWWGPSSLWSDGFQLPGAVFWKETPQLEQISGHQHLQTHVWNLIMERQIWKSIAHPLCSTLIFQKLSPWNILAWQDLSKDAQSLENVRSSILCTQSLPLLRHLQSRKLPSIQTWITLRNCSKREKKSFWVSRFSSKFKHFTLFLGTKNIQVSQGLGLKLARIKKVQFHSTGCKQVPAVPVKAAQTQPLWQKSYIYSHSYMRKT